MLSDIVFAGGRHMPKSIIGGTRPTPTRTSQPVADATFSHIAMTAKMTIHPATIDPFKCSNCMRTTVSRRGRGDCSELHSVLNERQIDLTEL